MPCIFFKILLVKHIKWISLSKEEAMVKMFVFLLVVKKSSALFGSFCSERKKKIKAFLSILLLSLLLFLLSVFRIFIIYVDVWNQEMKKMILKNHYLSQKVMQNRRYYNFLRKIRGRQKQRRNDNIRHVQSLDIEQKVTKTIE